ncbi:hypothetical protein TH63_02715 [Rufibacter radiotolerans]|uniref:Glycosyltransferase 2-like domain-containing protein n=1 Tax=Rufibacter radiotolerans TaxID=1379910 RepID=A0A0H4W2V9_9BACT|nr:glycosyltransferase [Rufibacter radiotolerans]AKQ44781.1 hypothetical protein TH63_02715 [Rufibacter radiotolerans]
MKISIVVPVYKTEIYLRRCIESLINQTIVEKEIILVNDASPDNSLEILLEYKNNYPDLITVIDLPENRCLGGARNAGIKASTGKFIGFVDSDDFVHKEMYEALVNKALLEDADIVDCDALVLNENGKEISVEISNTKEQVGLLDKAKRKSLILNTGRVFTKVFRRELFFSNNLFFQEKVLFDENNLIPILLVFAKKIEKVDYPYYNYVLSSNSTCRGKVEKYSPEDRYFNERLLSTSFVKQRFIDNGLYSEFQEEVDFVVFKLYLSTLYGTYERYKVLPYHRLKELKKVKDVLSNLHNNSYYKNLDWKSLIWFRINSIHPKMFSMLYSLNKKINDTIR